ncbi:MAG: SIR2 family protein [Acidobacteriota bacterium]
MMIEERIPKALIDSFRSGESPVIFIGSGMGREASPPIATAEDLAEEVCKELNIKRNGENLSELLQYLKNTFSESDAELVRWLQKKLLHDVAAPTCTHRLILELPTREFLTTNYDHLLSMAATEMDGLSLRLIEHPKDWPDGAVPLSDAAHLGLIHGSFGGRALVATTDDYIDHYKKFGRKWLSVLEGIFRRRVVVFIGYSMRDFTTWTSYISTRLRYGREMRGHYMVAPVTGSHIVDYWRRYGQQFIPMTAKDFLIAVHRRLDTFYSRESVAVSAVAAANHWSFGEARTRICSHAGENGHDDLFRSAESMIQEVYR